MLRFKKIEFATGGSFKLCFCDSSLLPTHGGVPVPCSSEADYAIEVPPRGPARSRSACKSTHERRQVGVEVCVPQMCRGRKEHSTLRCMKSVCIHSILTLLEIPKTVQMPASV